ncbi:MAG: translocation/assembly module TamB domain-containing protein [Anaeromyxobacteraceae bacterium]
MKARVAIVFVAVVLALGGGALFALRTPWAGARLCSLALGRVRAATGLAVAADACRVDPFHLEVTATGIRAGEAAAAPLFSAESLRVRLGPVAALGGRVVLREVHLAHPRVTATLPPSSGGRDAPCPPPALDAVEIQRLAIDGGSIDLRFPGGERLVVGRLDVRSVPERRGALAALASPGPRRAGIDVDVGGARVEWDGRALDVDAARVSADLALDLSHLEVHEASARAPGLELTVKGRVERLCRPRFDLDATARGDVRALLALLGRPGADAAGAVRAEVALTGTTASPRLDGEVRLAAVRLGSFHPGDATARLRLRGKELRVEALEVPGQGGRVSARGVVRFGAQVELEAEADLAHVELGEVFARLGLPGAWVMARLDGRLHVAGTAWPLRLDGDAALDFADFRALGHGWERYRPGEAAFVDVPRGHIEGTVRVVPDGVRVLAARARAGVAPPLSVAANLHFDGARGFEVTGEGGIDLGFLRHLGPVPIAGIASVEGLVVRAAPYGNPHAEARARVAGLHFLDLDLGDAAARLTYDAFVLRVEGGEGRRGATRYDADAQVDLAKDPVRVDRARYGAEGRLRDLFEAAMPWQPKARHARDALDGEVHLRGTASGPAPALDAAFEGELGPGVLAERRFDGGRFGGRIERGVRAVFDRAELRRGAGLARGAGTVGFDAPFPWSFDVTAAGVRLPDLGLGDAWVGALGGTAALRGSWDDPTVRFTGRCEDLEAYDVSAGAVELGVTLEHGAIAATARAEGVRASATGRAAGDVPFEARAELDVEDVARHLPHGAVAGLHARVRGVATASGTLADLAATRAELRLDEVRGGYGDFRVDATPPVVLSVAAGRLALRSFKLSGANTEFVLEGVRERSGELALSAKGALDLRLLAGLLPGVEEPRGQLDVEARVGGTVAEPLLVGQGALRDGAFHVKNAPIAFAGVAGELAFSQSRMIFDRVEALVNGARAELHGEVELARLRPVRVKAGAHIDEVPVRIPAWLPAVMTGELAAEGTWEDMLLSGRLHVVRARYTDPVDLEKSIVELKRKRPVVRPFDPADGWLRFDLALVVDGDARIENDLVRAGVTGALTLTGSLASPGLLGALTLTDGSRGTFRGNEFALSHAVVDFTDRNRIRMRLDVNGDTRVRDYGVFMHLFGYYPEPTLQLTSQPALSQEDIVTLLSLGFTQRDAAAAGGVTGAATAAAAQALFSASGLDDQVKRFVPRGKLLRDFSVRITTAYSEAAGQVEPRAELESKVLDDRLRLRYQAPLAGARGQRAQAEVRLGNRTSIQYQWDNDTPEVAAGGDHGVDLKLRWEWND